MTPVKEWIDKKIEDGDILYFEYSKFSNVDEIGKGAFGKVSSADYTNTKIALKRFSDGNSSFEENDINKLNELVDEVGMASLFFIY